MTNSLKKFFRFTLPAGISAGAIIAFLVSAGCKDNCSRNSESGKVVRAQGFVRGFNRTVLCNKYAGFLTKVNAKDRDIVKAGDVILEYDDLTFRTQLSKAENAVLEQRNVVRDMELALMLKKLEPLPSDYRTLKWKYNAAEAKAKRSEHELSVYEQLLKSQSVSDLAFREKLQNHLDAKANLESYSYDIHVAEQGLGKIYLAIAEQNLKDARQKLTDLERDLALVKEDGKYYKIVAPYDGIIIVNSDTVHNYYTAGTQAAELHRVIKGKKVYAYADERDMHHFYLGQKCRFRSYQYDCNAKGFAEVTIFEISKIHSGYGDRSLYLLKSHVTKEVEPLQMDTTGCIEFDVK